MRRTQALRNQRLCRAEFGEHIQRRRMEGGGARSPLRSSPASSTVTGTPWRTRLAAAMSPTGPAPAIRTRSDIGLRVLFRRSHRLDAGLLDDAAPLHRLGFNEISQRVGAGGSRFRALVAELRFDRGIVHSRLSARRRSCRRLPSAFRRGRAARASRTSGNFSRPLRRRSAHPGARVMRCRAW